MQGRRFDLSDLLTASGAAMAASNRRLAGAGAPALLREFSLGLDFDAEVRVTGAGEGLSFRRTAQSGAQMRALVRGASATVRLSATYVAAPALPPGPGQGGVNPP